MAANNDGVAGVEVALTLFASNRLRVDTIDLITPSLRRGRHDGDHADIGHERKVLHARHAGPVADRAHFERRFSISPLIRRPVMQALPIFPVGAGA